MKKYARLALFVGMVMSVAATSAFVATRVNVTRLGTYWTTVQSFDSTAGNQTGGYVQFYLAGESLFVGRTVYMSVKNTAKSDSTLASYNKVLGVVVGGTRLSMQAGTDSLMVDSLAATNGQRVVVLVEGKTWVRMDTGAGVAPGALIQTSNKAGMRGRVMAKPTPIDSLYRVIGRIVDSGVTGRATLARIMVR